MELKFCPPLIGLTVLFEPPLDTKSYCWQVGGRPPSTCSAIHTVMHSVQYVHLYMVGARFLFLFSGYNHSWVSSLSKLATSTLPARGSFSSLAEGKILKQMRTAPDIVIKIQSAGRLTP